MGMNRHGLSRCEIHILNDKEFSFAPCQEATNQPNPKIVVKGADKPVEIKEEEKEQPEVEDGEKSPKEAKKETDEKPEIEKADETETDESMEVDKVENEDEIDAEKDTVAATTVNDEDDKVNADKEEPKDETAEKPKTPEKWEIDNDEKQVEKVEKAEPVQSPVEIEKEAKTPEKEKESQKVESDKKETEEPEPITVGVIEVENEEQKALVEAELAKQQAANRWPKDKFLMQRAEHVCFCITQGEWPTPKLINSLTGNGINDTRPVVIDSPRMADSPASDYRLGSSKHKSRGQRPQSRGSGGVGGGGSNVGAIGNGANSALSQLDANAHLFSKLNELAAGGQARGLSFFWRNYYL